MERKLLALFAIQRAAISVYVACECHSVLETEDMDRVSVDFKCLGRFALAYEEQGAVLWPWIDDI